MPALSLNDLKTLFYTTTITMTALPGTSVRHAFSPNTQPFTEQPKDVCYLNITETDDPVSDIQEIIYVPNDSVSAIQYLFYTRVMNVAWTFYGPNSYDNADSIRWQILTDPIRDALRPSSVCPIPKGIKPVRAPELRNSQYWERTDVKVNFNVGTLRSTIIPILASATIKIVDAQRIERIIEIPSYPDPPPVSGAYYLLQDGSPTLFEDGSLELLENGTLPIS